MPSNTVRTILIFGIIGLVLIGATVGGVFLLKSRNSSYAANQSQSQQKPEQMTAQQAKQEAKTDDQKKTDATKPSTSQPQPSAQQNQPVAPKPSSTSPNATPAPAQQPQNNSVVATGPSSLAATGPSFVDMMILTTLMMFAVFFGARILQARGLVRKHLG